jgi:hypothetical protein
MGKEIVKKEENAVVVFDDSQMMQDSAIGFQGLDVKDIAIPYIAILQALSPQVKKGLAKLEGAEEGDIFNNVTSKVVKGTVGISVIPCAYQKRYVEWKARESGGGFVKAHINESILANTTKNEKGQDVLPGSKHIVVTTAHHFVLVMNEDGSYERAVISMYSTQLKKSRKWNAIMVGLQAKAPNGSVYQLPPFSRIYQLTTAQEVKDTNSWYGWTIGTPQAITRRDVYEGAKAFSLSVNRGEIEVATPANEGGDTSAAPASGTHF